MLAVCALLAQLMAIYSVSWKYALGLAVAFEVIFVIYALTGGARFNLLWPVIFLTFLSTFTVRVNAVNVSSEQEDAFISCISEGVWGRVAKVEEKSAGTYIYISEAAPVSENEVLGDSTYGLLVIVDSEENPSETAEDIIPGCTVYIQGEGEVIPSATNPGQFDSYKYYRVQGYSFRSFLPEVEVVDEAGWFWRLLYRIKCGMAEILEEISCEDDIGVFKAMLLGDKAELDEETKSLFQSGGISHILAISGLHISFIGMLLYGLFRKLGLPISVCALAASAILICYTLLTGASVSAQRACVMMLLTFGATSLGRTPDMLSSMSLAWIIISIRYPYQITQAGCQMSFGAIFALGAFLPAITANIEHRKKKGEGRLVKFVRSMVSTLLASVSIQLITWPVLAWHYFQISVYSLLLNLLVLPLTSVLFGAILAAVLVGAVCGGLGFGLAAAKVVIYPAHLIMAFYRLLCEGSELLPGSILTTGRPLVWQIFIYAGLLLLVLIFLELRAKRREIRMEQDISQSISRVDRKTGRIHSGRWEYVICFVSLTVLMAVGLRLLVRVRGSDLTVVYADVGQGDGIFIQCGDIDMFIDGGSSSVTSVGTYRIEPLLLYYGVTDVDLWFLTHPDSDHTSGFLEVVEDSADAGATRISSLVINTASADSEEWDEIKTAIEEKGISLQLIEAGMALSAGELSIECLYPTESETFTDVNDLCTVLNITYGSVSFLMTGDISSDVETVLCERYADNPEKLACTVLKVPHHGSKYSSSEEFLDFINATYAVISCGKNTYGHPSDEAIERIENAGASIFCTLYDGAVILGCDGEKLFLE